MTQTFKQRQKDEAAKVVVTRVDENIRDFYRPAAPIFSYATGADISLLVLIHMVLDDELVDVFALLSPVSSGCFEVESIHVWWLDDLNTAEVLNLAHMN